MTSVNPVSNPSTAAAVNPTSTSPAGASQLNGSSTISSLNQLPPELKNMMMLGIAQNICSDMQDHQNRLDQLIKEGQQDG